MQEGREAASAARRSNSLSVRHFSLSYSPTTDVGSELTRSRSRAPAVWVSQLSSNPGSKWGGACTVGAAGGGPKATGRKSRGSRTKSALNPLRGDPRRDDRADAMEAENEMAVATDASARWVLCGSTSSVRNMPMTFLMGDEWAVRSTGGGVWGARAIGVLGRESGDGRSADRGVAGGVASR